MAHEKKQRGASKAQLAYRAERFGICSIEFNSFGHVCERRSGHAGPCFMSGAVVYVSRVSP